MDAALPLSGKAQSAWQMAQTLWEVVEKAYARSWRAAIEGDALVAEYLVLLAERTLYYGRMRARGELLVYRSIADALWQKLYTYQALSTKSGIGESKAKDSLIEMGSAMTPQALFIHVLLLATARSNRLSSRQLLWLDARLELFSMRTKLAPGALGIPKRLPLTIVPARPGAPVRGAQELIGPDFINLDTRALGQSLAKRIKLLREGELPQNLGLGAEFDSKASEALLAQAYRLWCEAPTADIPPMPENPARKTVALGFVNQHHDVGAGKFRTYEENAPAIGGRDVLDLQLFGRTVSRQSANVKPAVQRQEWLVLQESAQGLWMLRPQGAGQPVALRSLVLVHTGEQKVFGVVRALSEVSQGVLLLIQLLAGQPYPAEVRARDGGRYGQNEFSPAMILPPVPSLRSGVSLLLPHSWYRQGRMLEMWDGQNLLKIRLEQLMERGADFDRAQFNIV